jgi:mono/diheme cytochrome c family protein
MNQYPLGQIKGLWTLDGLNKLTATPILNMLKSDDPKVVCSALWASTKVLDAAEVAKLQPEIAALKPKTDEVKIYLARALGRFGPGPAFNALVDLLKTDREKPMVKQLAVAGLDHHETEFQAAIKGKISDGNLDKWLTAGALDIIAKPSAETTLTGDHLASFKRGKELFTGVAVCASCHGADGMGMPSLGPPLNQSEYVNGKPDILLAIILNGMSGPLRVNNIDYTPAADMPAFALNTQISDKDLADVATYIRHEWDNSADMVKPDQVTKMRAATASRAGKAYTAKDFQAK